MFYVALGLLKLLDFVEGAENNLNNTIVLSWAKSNDFTSCSNDNPECSAFENSHRSICNFLYSKKPPNHAKPR